MTKNIKINISVIGFFLLLFFILLTDNVKAEDAASVEKIENLNKHFSINLDKDTIAKGYTVGAFENKLKLSLTPGILDEATQVEIYELHEDLPCPWKLNLISDVYQFEFKNKAAYGDHNPFYIQFSYNEDNNNHKQVFFYDKNFNTWRPLPTKDFPKENFVRSLIHLPYARLAIFSFPNTLTTGRASWYAYKSGNYAASPDFPKGSKLRVYNMENGKFVDVEINDYGPERQKFPDRVIDLEKNAFARIASLGAGIIDIHVEPLHIAGLSDSNILKIKPEGIGSVPDVSAKAAIVIDEGSGKIFLEKNSTSTLPLASLTKLVAIKVFLDTKPTLNKVVAYSSADAEYNYEHVNKWESAELNIENGETLTIEDLLYTSLVGSANNTIESLVRVSPLSRGAFIAKMNFEVKRWGASTTHFIEPTGLAPENVSSALDYAIIAREVLKHPIIAKASTMKEYKFYTANTEKFHRVRNTNHIIRMDKYTINGSKTGYLYEAGYCLMTRVLKNIYSNLIVVTFNSDTRANSFTETEKLIQYGLKQI
ncbi:MAG: RlpA-like double-psi beta-barrel domain-containing protein [Patescibacteria group bacterium]|nr:RlpA-like double-psi beta-barrel domain-containing protein [Patescibacteria group bacterium]